MCQKNFTFVKYLASKYKLMDWYAFFSGNIVAFLVKFHNIYYAVCQVLQRLLCSVPYSTMYIMQCAKFHNVYYAVCQVL